MVAQLRTSPLISGNQLGEAPHGLNQPLNLSDGRREFVCVMMRRTGERVPRVLRTARNRRIDVLVQHLDAPEQGPRRRPTGITSTRKHQRLQHFFER